MSVSVRARAPVSAAAVRRIAGAVIRRERIARAEVSITFVGPVGIRSRNRQHLGHDWITDVIALAFPIADCRLPIAVGDIYICPAAAAANARVAGVSQREEMLRLVIHGVLHVLGYDHPVDESRMRSAMWRRQERYLRELS